MFRRMYALNLLVSAIGTVFCVTFMPSTGDVFQTFRKGFDAAALNSAFLSPVVFRTITIYGR